MVTSLDHVGVLKTRPIGLNLFMGVEEFLLAPRLYFETNGVECSHRGLSWLVDVPRIT
jgi:hypothetical protein